MKTISFLYVVFIISFSSSKQYEIKKDTPTIKSITTAWYNVKEKGELDRECVLSNMVASIDNFNTKGHITESKHFYEGSLIEKNITFYEDDRPIKGETRDPEDNVIRYWQNKYNKSGKIIEFRHYFSHLGLFTIQTHKYDQLGNETECIIKNANSNLIATSIYSYDNNNQMIEHVKTLHETNVCHKRIYKYDKKGNEIEQIFYPGDGRETSKFISEYDEKDNIKSFREYDKNGKLIYESSCLYEYDKFGEWITMKKFKNGELSEITERRIEYYK